MDDLPVTQKIYDLIKGYAPILNRLPPEFAVRDAIRAKFGEHREKGWSERDGR